MSTTAEDDATQQIEENEDRIEDNDDRIEGNEDRIEENEDRIEKIPAPQQTTIFVNNNVNEKDPVRKKKTTAKHEDSELPETIPVMDSDASITLSELEDDDTELWLITVPRHDSVRATIPGSKLGFQNPDRPKQKKEKEKKKNVGVLRGSYVYREQKPPNKGNMRATFVIQDENGKRRMQVAKPFARTISVAFDADMDMQNYEAPIKTYPKMPEGLEIQYFPLGSKRQRLE